MTELSKYRMFISRLIRALYRSCVKFYVLHRTDSWTVGQVILIPLVAPTDQFGQGGAIYTGKTGFYKSCYIILNYSISDINFVLNLIFIYLAPNQPLH